MASGDTLIIFGAIDNEPPASSIATLDFRNGHPVLDFASAGTEKAIFTGIMPQHYDGGGLTLKFHFTMTSATSGTVTWEAEFERCSDGGDDLDADSFAAANTGNGTANGTSGVVDVADVTFTDGADMDSVAAGDMFRLRVSRTDSTTGDAELHAVEIRET